MTRTALALAALLCAAPLAPSAAAPAPDQAIADAKCDDLPTAEERLDCLGWVAQVAEAEWRWDEADALTARIARVLEDRRRLARENERLRREVEAVRGMGR